MNGRAPLDAGVLMLTLAAMLNTSIDALMGYERRPIRSVEGTRLEAIPGAGPPIEDEP